MALNESVISAGTSINVGQLYVANSGVNGTCVPVVNQGSATAGALASALGCTVIKTYDGATRRGGFPAGWMGPAGAVNSFLET
jgi:hypothetical protein